MLVSICIPVYNMEQTLEKTIKSALNQTYNELEILLLDNRSTDKTLEIANSFNDSRLNVIRNDKNYGAYGNHNRCLELAKGEWVKFLHGDDELLPECIERFVQVLKDGSSENVALLSCSAIQYDMNEQESGRTFKADTIIKMKAAPVREFIAAGNIVGTPTMTFIHREKLLKIDGFDRQIEPISDGDCWINLRTYYENWYVPEYLVIIRDDPPDPIAVRERRHRAFMQKNIEQTIKWYKRDGELQIKPVADTVFGDCLKFDMIRYWGMSLRYLMVGRYLIMATLIGELVKNGMLLKSLLFYLKTKIMLQGNTSFRSEKWPQTLKKLIIS